MDECVTSLEKGTNIKKNLKFLTHKKIKIELPYYPAILLLYIYPKETKSRSQKDTCTPMFVATLLIIAKT